MRTIRLTETEARQLLRLLKDVRTGGYINRGKTRLAAMESVEKRLRAANEEGDDLIFLGTPCSRGNHVLAWGAGTTAANEPHTTQRCSCGLYTWAELKTRG